MGNGFLCFSLLSQLSVSIKLPSGASHVLDIDLACPVVVDRCSFKILSTKVSMCTLVCVRAHACVVCVVGVHVWYVCCVYVCAFAHACVVCVCV